MRTFGSLATLVALVICGGVMFDCSATARQMRPNSWPPKMKNFDIWGDMDSTAASDSSATAIQTAAGGSSASAGGDRDADNNNGDDGDMSSAEIVRSAYGRTNETGWRRAGKVLNFFPLPVDDECLADDGARSGICLNTYECRIQGGTSKGQCALGFGVCCVFTATCDQEVFNNITYIISPNFPSLMTRDIKSCKLKIKMISTDVSQLRLDFVHFSLGQPNRSTGICDGDHFRLSGGSAGAFTLCGQNHGQHIYYDVPAPKDTTTGNGSAASRQAVADVEDLADGIVNMVINFSDRFATSRLFEIRVTQIPFSQRAPAGCMQYFTGLEGIIQTFNFAENGRHLANQNYRACIRQETDMCSIQYEPCFERAFRIGPRRQLGGGGLPGQLDPLSPLNPLNPLAGGGGGVGPGGIVPANPATLGAGGLMPLAGAGAGAGALGDDPAALDQTPAASADDPNTVEGSGGGDLPAVPSVPAQPLAAAPAASIPAAPSVAQPGIPTIPAANIPPASVSAPVPAPSFFSLPTSITSFFSRGLFGFGFGGRATKSNKRRRASRGLWGGRGGHESRQQPAASAAPFYGSECTDRITLPCVVEDFIAAGMGNVPACLPIHCGQSLCGEGVLPCRIESTVTPFGIGVHFGDVGAEEEKGSPEDNIGACLRYNQVNCG